MSRIIEIDDASDPRVIRYANLRSVDRPPDGDSFIVEGRWCLKRLADSQHELLSVVAERGKERSVTEGLPESTPVYSLPTEQIQKLVGYHFHRGALACGRRPPLRCVSDLPVGGPKISIAALGVSEHENLGSIMRSAAAMGIEDLLIGPRTIDPFSRRVIRVSMGNVFNQTLYDLNDPVAQLQSLHRERNVRTVVATLDGGATPLDRFVPDQRDTVLVVGNEADGVEREVQDIATDRVTIPMQLGTDSLNVAVAAAIFMYELANRAKSGVKRPLQSGTEGPDSNEKGV